MINSNKGGVINVNKIKLKHGLIIVLIVVVLFIIPVLITIITKVLFANDLEITKAIGYNDIAGLIAQYYSVFLTLVLSVIVFLQTEKINTLEKKDYDFYIGINRVENAFELGNTFFISDSPQTYLDKSFNLVHSVYNDKVIHFININLDSTSNDFKIIPINLITKNKLIISSISINEINLKINFSNSNIAPLKKEMQGNSSIISGCFDNNSEILFGIGLHIPKYNDDMYSIDIEMQLEVRDQYENIMRFVVSSSILSENNKYYLVSSKTIKINDIF